MVPNTPKIASKQTSGQPNPTKACFVKMSYDRRMSQPRKKILFVITKSNYGGAQRYVHELAVACSSTHDVVVACGGQGLMVEKLQADGIRTIEIKHFQRDISLSKEWRVLQELWRVFRTEQPDVIHLNSSKAGLLGALVARAARMPRIIFTIHGWAHLEPRPWWWRTLTWLGGYVTVLCSHRSIPISQHDVDHSYLYGLKWKLAPVIYNGVSADPDLLERDPARANLVGSPTALAHQNDIWVVTTAELHPKKNLATAIDAVAHYNASPDTKQKIFYCIMGDGVLYNELQAIINYYEATEQIKLLGYVNDAKRYLHAGDIFLLPSKQEGLPFALLEAGAAGLPTITSRVCGIPEVITNQTHGLLFDPYDVDALVTALTTLATEPLTRATYGTMFRERTLADFSFTKMVEATKDTYRSFN